MSQSEAKNGVESPYVTSSFKCKQSELESMLNASLAQNISEGFNKVVSCSITPILWMTTCSDLHGSKYGPTGYYVSSFLCTLIMSK